MLSTHCDLNSATRSVRACARLLKTFASIMLVASLTPSAQALAGPRPAPVPSAPITPAAATSAFSTSWVQQTNFCRSVRHGPSTPGTRD